MNKQNTYGGLDYFRLIAAALVVAIHISPLSGINTDADFFLTRILARTAVPFFFMITGQFTVSEILYHDRKDALLRLGKCLKKTALLYLGAIILYLPIGIYAGHYSHLTVGSLLRMIFFDGTFYHLWYFPACMLGIVLLYVFSLFLKPAQLMAAALLCYLAGLFGDSYYGCIADISVLRNIYSFLFGISSYTRNGIFFAPLFLLLGVLMKPGSRQKRQQHRYFVLCAFCLSFAGLTAEGFLLRHFHVQRHDSMYFMLVPVMLCLYRLLSYPVISAKKDARTTAMYVYLLHPAVIVAVRLLSKVLHLNFLLVDNSLVHYLVVLLLSFSISFLLCRTAGHFRMYHTNHPIRMIFESMLPTRLLPSRKTLPQDRAWIELDLRALACNVEFLQSMLPKDCQLMPAVKANAYGHGAVPVSKELNRLGIDAFCVATVHEGAELRKAHIRGEILILGYTHPSQFPLLFKYRLTQTVIDYPYALLLNQYRKTIRVHIGIDTGMHRLGVPADDITDIIRILQLSKLTVTGMFTHLSADDTASPQDKRFTQAQAAAFYNVADRLKEKGYSVPKLHILSSYGILNYPEFTGDYARAGIALYGVLSTAADTAQYAGKLFPVLSLKTRIASVRTLHSGDTAGYGTDFTATKEMNIATLAIGYADGLPRALSNGNGAVLIRDMPAPVIGRICMDQTIVDISDIPDAATGDTAIIIGSSQNHTIRASDLAEQSKTITNEILSRLGQRLPRIIKK